MGPVLGQGFQIGQVGIADKGGHCLPVRHVDVPAAFKDVMDGVGALIHGLGAQQHCGDRAVGVVEVRDSLAAACGVDAQGMEQVLVGQFFQGGGAVGEGPVHLGMSGGKGKRDGLAGGKGAGKHSQPFRLPLRVALKGQAAGAAAGIALLVIDPGAQAHVPAGLEGIPQQLPFLRGLQIMVLEVDVGDHAAVAQTGQLLQLLADDRLFFPDGGFLGIVEAVYDFQGFMGDGVCLIGTEHILQIHWVTLLSINLVWKHRRGRGLGLGDSAAIIAPCRGPVNGEKTAYGKKKPPPF